MTYMVLARHSALKRDTFKKSTLCFRPSQRLSPLIYQSFTPQLFRSVTQSLSFRSSQTINRRQISESHLLSLSKFIVMERFIVLPVDVSYVSSLTLWETGSNLGDTSTCLR